MFDGDADDGDDEDDDKNDDGNNDDKMFPWWRHTAIHLILSHTGGHAEALLYILIIDFSMAHFGFLGYVVPSEDAILEYLE